MLRRWALPLVASCTLACGSEPAEPQPAAKPPAVDEPTVESPAPAAPPEDPAAADTLQGLCREYVLRLEAESDFPFSGEAKTERLEACVQGLEALQAKDQAPLASIRACMTSTKTAQQWLACTSLGRTTSIDTRIAAMCKKMERFVREDASAPAEVKERAADIAACVAEGKKERVRDPEDFARQAHCVETSDSMAAVTRCIVDSVSQ